LTKGCDGCRQRTKRNRVRLACADEGGTPVRFEGSLLPGQGLAVSIPDSASAKAQTIALVRRGNRLLVEANPMEGG
jgi:hypothetical protein